MKAHQVHLTRSAKTDLNEIYAYIKHHDSVEQAAKIVDELQAACATLSQFPERGHISNELAQLGPSQYREIVHSPWRIIYQVVGQTIFIYGVFDGRRNMQSLLAQRITRP